MRHGLRGSLKAKIAAALAAGLLVLSLGLVSLFAYVYSNHMRTEQAHAVKQVNLLLRTSLENAMLKRDLQGLREILRNFGAQSGVSSIMILNRTGEVRFASNERAIGAVLDELTHPCAGCAPAEPYTVDSSDMRQTGFLRGVHPVPNQSRCEGCHGAITEHSINGYLVVDFDSREWKKSAVTSTMVMLVGATAVTFASLGLLGFTLQRWVVAPVASLAATASEIAEGAMSARATPKSKDEIGDLAIAFNAMADRVETHVKQIEVERKFLQSVVDAVPDGIRVIDHDYRLVLVNRAYRKLTGEGTNCAQVMHCYQSSHSRSEPCVATLENCPLIQLPQHNSASRFLQYFETTKGARSVEIHAARVHSKVDTEQGMVVEVIRDLEAEVQFSHEQRLAAIGQLAAGVAHEIRNPLSSVRLALQTVLRSMDQSALDPASLRHYLEVVDREIDNCVAITTRLLQMCATPNDTLQLVDINAAINETLDLVRYEAEQKRITLRVTADARSPRVLGSESDMRILVLNLVQNAFHAMVDGGTLQVETTIVDDNISMIFKDNGVGIQHGDMPHIFEPFFSRRADATRGSGLGLSIVKSIVERHQGTVNVKSSVGQGSTFTVILPSAEKTISRVYLPNVEGGDEK